jgi:chromosome partitioning protein
MIIVVAGIKGGVGKSTIAANLAVIAAADGLAVLLVDSDAQQTSLTWAAARATNPAARYPVTTVAVIGPQIAGELRRLAGRYDLVIVDAGARDTDTQRIALAVADLALLPLPPRGPDLWTLDAMAATLRTVRQLANPALPACVFVNRADPIGTDNAEAETAFAEHADDMTAAPVRVGNRKGIATAHLVGLGVIEAPRPDGKAADELLMLYRHAFDTAAILS